MSIEMTSQQTVQELLERARVHINGSQSGDILVHNEQFYDRVLAEGSLGLGESYMDGWWDANQLDQFFFRIHTVELDKAVRDKGLIWNAFKARLFNMQTQSRSKRVAQLHYDLNNEFYEQVLGPHMQYTCAYWKRAKSLSEAQEQKLSQILMVIIGGLVVLYLSGVNIAAALTGLGIGGIAIAFAAQKTLENLFGGIMVISDQPVRVGDFCRAGEHLGTVESIGLRSTRIRTLKRTVVSVPNGQLAVMSLENFTMRGKIWFHHTLHLGYKTTADQLRYILAQIRKMLYEHLKVESSSARTRFTRLGNSSLDVEVFAYVLETEYESFLHIQEDLLLRIMDIVKASGSGFAFPSQTTYLAGDAGLDAAKSQKAVEAVRQWREQGRLPFPDFSPETSSEMENKIEYPPPDSALRDKRRE